MTGPFGACNFTVTIGQDIVGLAEVAGLGCVIDYDAEHRPSTAVGDVALRRAVTGDATLWSWFDAVGRGVDTPRTVTVMLLDAQQRAVCAWVLTDARPVRWQGPFLDAAAPVAAMEELVVRPQQLGFHAAGRIPSSLLASLGIASGVEL